MWLFEGLNSHVKCILIYTSWYCFIKQGRTNTCVIKDKLQRIKCRTKPTSKEIQKTPNQRNNPKAKRLSCRINTHAYIQYVWHVIFFIRIFVNPLHNQMRHTVLNCLKLLVHYLEQQNSRFHKLYCSNDRLCILMVHSFS